MTQSPIVWLYRLILTLAFLATSGNSYSEVVYEKLGFTDAKGREVVSLRIEGEIGTYEINDFNKLYRHPPITMLVG